ncbi:TonB-dependent receptor [Rhodanobacter sp. Soil772]|uniref:TonB-dependent receptor plug domain-containing protein n=1 Tax=Rhodanobacter sp. Soil772 TaxID=1736406 RepID=UPI000A973919|nr:TonB-dependent receptor [Rhodanobacter sp. Soil772]
MHVPAKLGDRFHAICRHPSRIALCATVMFGLLALPAHASLPDLPAQPEDLTSLSLEELGNIQITSVSKKPERLSDAAASVFVITADDIRRSGARNLPEALRLAPNLQVAEASAVGYAISARGMNGSNNSAPNKLLVLIDGRSVYSPLFSGVFWDAQDVMLEDVERIEVISGPGGTLWGVNAVNGVINIITRSAENTHGALLTTAVGNGGSDLGFRYGATLGANGDYRVYGKHTRWLHGKTADGATVDDAGHRSQVGFRTDWHYAVDRFTVEGNVYDGSEQQPAPGAIAINGVGFVLGDVSNSGVNLTARWNRALAEGGSLDLQAYYDHTRRTVPPTFGERLDILDFQLQHSLRPLGMHALVWGVNARQSRDRVENLSPYFAFLPAQARQRWTSVFAQDEMTLANDLRLTLGARLERNDYTGTEFLPNARLAWKAAPGHLFWTAVSRTVRAPSRLDRDAYIPAVPPYLLNGGDPVRSEVAKVYELGYRGQPTPRLSWSATVFHNDYDHLRTQEIDPSFTYLFFGSLMEGQSNGIEWWGTFQATKSWRLSGGFTALDEHFRLKPGSNDAAGPSAEGFDPSNTWQLRSSWTLGSDSELAIGLRHVGALARDDVPAYTAVDARLGWTLAPGAEISLTGRNLSGGHGEYRSRDLRREIGRSVILALAWAM